LSEKPAADSISEIIRTLEAGQHIILSFGNFDNDLDYLLVSATCSPAAFVRPGKSAPTISARRGKSEPRPLVLVVEEAHKLLNKEMASQTSF
jgi:uncharacterized protein